MEKQDAEIGRVCRQLHELQALAFCLLKGSVEAHGAMMRLVPGEVGVFSGKESVAIGADRMKDVDAELDKVEKVVEELRRMEGAAARASRGMAEAGSEREAGRLLAVSDALKSQADVLTECCFDLRVSLGLSK